MNWLDFGVRISKVKVIGQRHAELCAEFYRIVSM